MTIQQDVTINATPDAVYEVLTNAEKFSEMSGGRPAEISSNVGGAVSLFGGAISALNIELVPGVRVVQSWRSADWPAGVHSIIRFELSADGAGTKLSFTQAGHPEEAAAHLNEGWNQMYWGPMNALLGKT